MTPKSLAALLLVTGLLAVPFPALARDCPDRVTLSCPEGQSWDEKTKSCIIPSS